jgi:hypothetical protein
MSFNPAMKRYNLRVIWLTLLYAIFLLIAVYSFKQQLLHGALAWLAAVLPALPLIGIFGATGRYLIEEKDEYVRMVLVRQSLWAGPFALSAATVWDFLESFDLGGHVKTFYIAILWFFGLGVGSIMNKVTLGTTVKC